MFVVKFTDGTYYYGYNTWGDQLRKAMIYTSLKRCKEAAEDSCKKFEKDGYHIVRIEMREVAIVE